MPVGTGLASGVANRLRVPAIYIVLAGSCVQVIGFALLGTLPLSLENEIPSRIYGFEFLAGFGCGMNFTPLFLLIPSVVLPRDQGKSFSLYLSLSPWDCNTLSSETSSDT